MKIGEPFSSSTESESEREYRIAGEITKLSLSQGNIVDVIRVGRTATEVVTVVEVDQKMKTLIVRDRSLQVGSWKFSDIQSINRHQRK